MLCTYMYIVDDYARTWAAAVQRREDGDPEARAGQHDLGGRGEGEDNRLQYCIHARTIYAYVCNRSPVQEVFRNNGQRPFYENNALCIVREARTVCQKPKQSCSG